MPSRSRRSRRATPQGQLTSTERLEARVYLSVNPVLDQGVLTIEGSQGEDHIHIRDDAKGLISVQDGATGQVWEFRGVKQIVVDAGESDDTVKFTRDGDGGAPVPELDFHAGEGNDDVTIGLLLPAVQKVRAAASRAQVDLGEGDDKLSINSMNVSLMELDITAGGGDDDVAVGMLLPAIQKVRDSANRSQIDLGEGDNVLRIDSMGYDLSEMDITSGEGGDSILIGMLLPAIQKVRDAAGRASVDLGGGNDQLTVNTDGVEQLDLDITSGQGDDSILIGMLLPAIQKVRDAANRSSIDLGDGNDQLTVNTEGVGYVEQEIASGGGDDSVLVGMLLPAIQKVRDAANRSSIDLGDGNDQLIVNTEGVGYVEQEITSGEGDDSVLIGMLLPAIQKVRDAANRSVVDLGGGNDLLTVNTTGVENVDLDITSGEGDDHVLIGLLVPAVQKVRDAAARINVDLGGGNDQLDFSAGNVPYLELDITAGDGDDAILIGMLLPAVQKVRQSAATVNVDLGAGVDRLFVHEAGYVTFLTNFITDENDTVQVTHGPGRGEI